MKIVKQTTHLDLEDFLTACFAYQSKPLSKLNPKMSLQIFEPRDYIHACPLAEMSVKPINAHVMIQEGASKEGVKKLLDHIAAWEKYCSGEALVVFPDEVVAYP